MSNDQRPARLRLVSDGGKKDRRGRARAVPETIEGTGREIDRTAAEYDAPRTAGSAGPRLLAILLFLLACAVGGAGVVMVRLGVIG